MDMNFCGLWQLVMDREAWRAMVHMGLQRVEHDWVTELNWRDLLDNINCSNICILGVSEGAKEEKEPEKYLKRFTWKIL